MKSLPEESEPLVKDCIAVLIEVAKMRRTITYQQLEEKLGASHLPPQSPSQYLNPVARYSYRKWGIILSAIVVEADTFYPSNSPGHGFGTFVFEEFDVTIKSNSDYERLIKKVWDWADTIDAII